MYNMLFHVHKKHMKVSKTELASDGTRWQTQVDSFQHHWQPSFLFPLREFPEALAIIHTLLFFCSVPHKLSRCSPQRLPHDRLTHSQSFFLDFCLYFFSSLHTRDSGFDTPTCCEFQIHLSGSQGRGGGVWRESLRGEISAITNTPAESLHSNFTLSGPGQQLLLDSG